MLRPGMIQFSKIDLGEDHGAPMGCASSESSRRYFPSLWISGKKSKIDLPDEGEATVRFKVTRREASTADGKTTHSATVEVHSIDTGGKKKRLPGEIKRLGALRPGMIEFDDRQRNNNGQFVANETGGADPNSMAAAYGPAAERVQKRSTMLQRLRATLGGGQ